jgi:hypothetical protein
MLVLESGFVAVEGYLFDGLGQIWQVIVGVDFEELNEFFFFERGDY